MNRIDQIFTELRREGRKALMPFLTAGDPDLATTVRLLGAVERAGASVVELGIAFSDPIADGPVIQASMTHALERGVRVSQVLEAVRGHRGSCGLGLVAMVSYSIVHRLGPGVWIERAKAAGFDGFIFPDLPIEESDEVVGRVRDAGMSLSMLIAPSSDDARAERIARACSGFVYVLSRSGITGERAELPPELPQRLRRLREVTDLPLAVGFGIATAEQVRQVVEVADAAIVGSAVMRRVADARSRGTEAVVTEVERFVRELAGGLRGMTAVA